VVIGVLTKKTFRTLLKSRGQVLAVAAVVMCGTACYIALASCHRNLLLTRDSYYAENRFADFEISLERAPETVLFKIQEIPGVRQVRGRIVEEVKLELVDAEDEGKTGRIVSMPDRRGSVINNVVVTQGRYFEPGAVNEVILSEKFAEANELGVGETIRATIDGRKHTLKIVGLGASPEYVYVIRGLASMVPEPDRFGILWVPEKFAEDAKNMQAACNNIVGTLENPEDADRVLDVAADILDAYGVYSKVKRENQISNRFISDEIRGLGVQARITPTVFLGVAALVIFIVLNRMVRNERTQIGLLKAYGHSNLTVAMHYLQYALAQAVLGVIGGFVAGQWMAGGMIRLYVQFYSFPILRSQIYPDVLVNSLGIAVLFSVLGALSAARRAARIRPAESMRPGVPLRGRRTVFESFPAMWRRLSFTWKMIVRNVSRNSFRAGLNVFGVAISSAQLIVGFFAMDAMKYILDFQYRETQRQDATVSFFFERGKDALYETARLPHVREAEPLLQYPFEMTNGWRSKDVVVVGLERDSDMQRLMDTKNRRVDIGENGLVLSSALASSLNVAVGDEVELKPLMGKITKEKSVPVSRIVEQYFGMSGYMNIEALSRVLDEPYAMNAALVRTDRGFASELHDEAKDIPMIVSVDLREDALRNLQETIAQSMRIMGVATVLFAGVIAFSIIYNVTVVSLSERERELASLRVLGFTQREVGAILFNENFLTGAIGLLLGIPVGMAMVWGMMHAFNTDLFRFPFHIAPRTYFIATGLSIVFIAIANFAVRRKIHRLDMVETLKARE
jgi:putative ABC transport system permease protein